MRCSSVNRDTLGTRPHALVRGSVPFLALVGWCSLGCQVEAVAPERAVLTMAVEPADVATGGDSATVWAVIRLESGDLVPYGATVTFISSVGALCAATVPSAPCSNRVMELPPALKVVTEDGVAKVTFRSGTQAGPATVVAQSGSATDSVIIQMRDPGS